MQGGGTYLDDGPFYHVFNIPGNPAYDVATRSTTPILTVFFETPNSPTSYLGYPKSNAQLTCLHVTDFAKGSRVSPRLPAGTPYSNSTASSSASSSKGASSSSGLSGGDIAGIVVGAVAVVAITAAVGFTLWRLARRRRSPQTDEWREAKVMEREPVEDAHELDSGRDHELSPVYQKPEIDGAQVLEAGGAQGAAELDARPRYSFDSDERSVLSYATATS